MPRPIGKSQPGCSCGAECVDGCTLASMVETDWMSELLDMDSLQFDPALLPDEQLQELVSSCSSPESMRAELPCSPDCGCGFSLQPLSQQQHVSSGEALPALEALLRGGQQDGTDGSDMDKESWLKEWHDGMDIPSLGVDPLEAMLAQLAGSDEQFDETTAAAIDAGSPTAAAQPRSAAPAASPSRSGTAASVQTHVSANSRQQGPIGAGTASAATQPAHSGDSAHSAARVAAASTIAVREPSPAYESRRQARLERSSSGSPATSDSEGSPFSGQRLRPAASSEGEVSPQSGSPHGEKRSAAALDTRGALQPAVQMAAAPQHAAPQLQSPVQSAQQQQPQWQPPAHQAQQQSQPQQPQATFSRTAEGSRDGSGGSQGENEAQRAAHAVRNRDSAQVSRQRKKAQVDEVQRRCNELQSHNTQLAGMVQRLTAENAVLRHQLLAVCAATGAAPPAPAPPPPMAPGFAPPAPGAAFTGGTHKIPIQKLKPQRPAPAPQPQRAAAGGKPGAGLPVSSPPAAGQPARKKLKTAAGATTALLAVFACVMLLSPLAPPGGAGPLQGGQVAPYRSLPAGQVLMGGHGRVLTALPPAQLAMANSTHAMAVEVVRGMLNDLTDLEGSGRSGEGVKGSAALALRYNDPVLETLALQRLKELAPLALFSAGEGRVLPGGRTFGSVARDVLGGEGLAAPVACQEVFRFDAARLLRPDFPAARMEAYIDSLTAPKRRRPQALPLLPASADSSQEDRASSGMGGHTHAGTGIGGNRNGGGRQQQRGHKRATIGGDGSQDGSGGATGNGSSGGLGGSTLVSMLLPTRNASLQQAGNLTALDQIFVVMMEPSDTYATYSCRLPSPVLV